MTKTQREQCQDLLELRSAQGKVHRDKDRVTYELVTSDPLPNNMQAGDFIEGYMVPEVTCIHGPLGRSR